MNNYLTSSENYYIFGGITTGVDMTNEEKRIAEAMANVLDGYDWHIYTQGNNDCNNNGCDNKRLRDDENFCGKCGTKIQWTDPFLDTQIMEVLVQAFNAALLVK